MKKAMSYVVGAKLGEILGIPNLTDVKIHFPLDGLVTANVCFYLNEVQAKAVLELCEDGKWWSPPSGNFPVETTTMESKRRTYIPSHE